MGDKDGEGLWQAYFTSRGLGLVMMVSWSSCSVFVCVRACESSSMACWPGLCVPNTFGPCRRIIRRTGCTSVVCDSVCVVG